MKKRIIVFLFLLSFILLSSTPSQAFWVWTPDTKMFVNPKFAVKDTPKEQFEWAMKFYKENNFNRAAEEFIRLTDHYTDSDLAPEAQYYAGRSFEELGKYYPAFKNYQKVIDNYPYSDRVEAIIEREYHIANIFQTKKGPKLMDIELSLSLDRAATIYKKVVENSTFGKYADKSLYKMAQCYRKMGKYKDAMEAYERLINDYPESELVEESKYQLAYTMYEASKDPEYDQENTDEAIEKFEKLVDTTGIPELVAESDKVIAELKIRKAESLFDTALFYEKNKKYRGAIMYYKEIVEKYPSTGSAIKAEQKIEKLKGKVAR